MNEKDLNIYKEAFDGEFEDVFKEVIPIIDAYATDDISSIKNVNMEYKEQLKVQIENLKLNGIKKIIIMSNPKYYNEQFESAYVESVDASKISREYSILADITERYIDFDNNIVSEVHNDNALITIGKSKHIDNNDNEWMLDYFYIGLLNNKSKDKSAKKEQIIEKSVDELGKAVNFVQDKLNSMDEKKSWNSYSLSYAERNENYDNYLGALFTVAVVIIFVPIIVFLALPSYLKIIVSIILFVLLVIGLNKLDKTIFQNIRKKRILRFSDSILRYSIYKELNTKILDDCLDFSLGKIFIKSCRNKKGLSIIKINTIVTKRKLDNGTILEMSDRIKLKLSRSRYPERKRNKGKEFKGEICPSCGNNFIADDKECCSNCGYGLVHNKFIWRVQ